MRFKIDENLPVEVARLVQAAGHEVETVPAEGLAGQPDADSEFEAILYQFSYVVDAAKKLGEGIPGMDFAWTVALDRCGNGGSRCRRMVGVSRQMALLSWEVNV